MTDISQDNLNRPAEERPDFSQGSTLVPAIMALLFAAGDPLSIEELAHLTDSDEQAVTQALARLEDKLARDPECGLILRRLDSRCTLSTSPEQKTVLERFYQPKNRPRLTQANFEVLAVVAYNQPVTRAQIEAVRGVNSDAIVTRLEERGYIYASGTLDAPGRPTLFSTTDKFLLETGIASLDELPPMEMIQYSTLRDFEHKYEQQQGRDAV